MTVEGGCYCGAVRYRAQGDALMRAECFCRECQYFTGGGQLLVMVMPTAGFEVTKGSLQEFSRDDIENPVTRKFCGKCGTHLFGSAPGFDAILLKVGSLDDPSVFKSAESANFACDAWPHHRLPGNDEMPTYQKWMHD